MNHTVSYFAIAITFVLVMVLMAPHMLSAQSAAPTPDGPRPLQGSVPTIMNGDTWDDLGGGVTGMDAVVNTILEHDGFIYVGGVFDAAGGENARNIARFNLSTSQWEAMGTGTDDGMASMVNDITVHNGLIYVGGYFTQMNGQDIGNLAVYNPTGSGSWSSIGTFGHTDPSMINVFALHVFGDDLYVGGDFQDITKGVSELEVQHLARYDITDGDWHRVGTYTSSDPFDVPFMDGTVMAIDGNDTELVFSGMFLGAGDQTVNGIVRYNPAGSGTWTSLSPGVGEDDFPGNATYGDGVLYVAGDFYTDFELTTRIKAYSIQGNTWTSIGGVFNNSVINLKYHNGALFVTGDFTVVGEVSSAGIAKYDPVGGSWSTFGTGVSSFDGAFSGAVSLGFAENRLIVGGIATAAGGASVNNIARWREVFAGGGDAGGGGDDGGGGADPALPGAFTVSSTVPATLNIGPYPRFEWNASTGAVSYSLEITKTLNGSEPDFSPGALIAPLFGITDLFFDFSDLGIIRLEDANTEYHWRVVAGNNNGFTPSNVRSFTTMSVPASFSLSTPITGAENQPVRTAFTWETSTHAESYTLQIALDADVAFSSPVLSYPGILINSHTLSEAQALTHGTIYRWRVLAINEFASGEDEIVLPTQSTETLRFTTQSLELTAPTLVAPTPDPAATDVPLTPTFTWSKVELATGYTLSYYVTASGSGSATSVPLTIIDDLTDAGQNYSYTLLDANKLLPGTNYTWSVTATAAGLNPESSATATFTTDDLKPGNFTWVAPTGDSFDDVPLLLQWTPSDRATGYKINIKLGNQSITDPPLTTNETSISLDETNFLIDGFTYTFELSAVNENGETTVDALTIAYTPTKPTAVSPTGGAVVDESTMFSWNSTESFGFIQGNVLVQILYSDNEAADPTEDEALGIQFDFQDPEVIRSKTLTELFATQDTRDISEILTDRQGQTLYWRVSNKSFSLDETDPTAQREVVWSDLASFSVVNPPTPFDLLSPTSVTPVATVTPTFTWKQSENADSYELKISTSELFEEPLFTSESLPLGDDLNSVTFTLPDANKLIYGQTYFWRVKATGAGGSVESDASFTITNRFILSAENNVTISCTEAAIGEKGLIDGKIYTKRDRAGLNQLKSIDGNNPEFATTCTSGIPDMSSLFFEVSSFDRSIGSWDVSAVTNMFSMFSEASSFDQSIGNWDVRSVTDMSYMFYGARSFDQPTGNWDVRSVRNMSNMFANALAFDQPIGEWNVRSVTDMRLMFAGATAFNKDIGNWDVRSVTIMIEMFRNASVFDQDLRRWCVPSIGSEPSNFADNSALSPSNYPLWGTCVSVAGTGTLLSGTDLNRASDGVQAATITVQLKDMNGQAIALAGVEVTFTTDLGTLSSETAEANGSSVTALTNASGLASVKLTSTATGDANVTANITGPNHGAVTNGSPVTVKFATPPRLVLAPAAAGSVSGVAFTTQPKVQIQNAEGKVQITSTATVTMTLSATPTGVGQLNGTTALAAVLGEVVYLGISITGPAGEYGLTFSAPGYTSVTQTITIAPTSTGVAFASGDGSKANPYVITDVDMLQAMKDHSSSHFKLGNDIQAIDTKDWNPNGNITSGFEPVNLTGSFDGDFKIIYDLYINRPETDYVGLFSHARDIQNVGLVRVDITGRHNVGGLAGNITASLGANILNSFTNGKVSGQTGVGGLVGYLLQNSIRNSYSQSSVSGTEDVGGLVGRVNGGVSFSYSAGLVTGDGGGIIGSDERLTLAGSAASDSYWDIDTSSKSTSEGGGTGRSTALMKTESTYTNWDFGDIWFIDANVNNGYPSLRSFAMKPNFYLADNGVTIVCTDAKIGDTGVVNGITYTKRAEKYVDFVDGLDALWNHDLNNPEFSKTCTSGITDMSYLFYSGLSNRFNQDISSWDVSSVTDMSRMFGNAVSFNQDISAWDVSKVTDMESMFSGTTAFNKDLRKWCVTNITSKPDNFSTSSGLSLTNHPLWGTCPSTTKLVVRHLSANGTSGKAFTIQPEVAFQNGNEVVHMTAAVKITLSSGPLGAMLNGETSVVAVGGIVNFFGISITGPPGEYTLTFAATGYASVSRSITIESPFASGTGTVGDPYVITNLDMLQAMAKQEYLSSHFKLGGHIDARATSGWPNGGFEPIGTNANRFTGQLDGHGFVITGLTINRPEMDNVGLFGNLGTGARVTNTGLWQLNITGRNAVGGLIGANLNGTVTNSYSNGMVVGNNRVGGLVGHNTGSRTQGEFTNNYSSGSVIGNNQVGGLVGVISQGSFTNSYSSSSVEGNDEVGGLAGSVTSGEFNNNYASGSVKGLSQIGGLVGMLNFSQITTSYASGLVIGGSRVGGLVGSGSLAFVSSINNSFWDRESSKQGSSVGGTGKTTEEMKTLSTFTNWNFTSIWQIEEGNTYPFLVSSTVNPPQLNTPIEAELVTFSWAGDPTAGYVFEIHTDKSVLEAVGPGESRVTDIILKEENASRLSLEVSPGLFEDGVKYYWRVSMKVGSNPTTYLTSTVGEFTPIATPQVVTVTYPGKTNNENVPVGGIRFSWEPDAVATKYQILVYKGTIAEVTPAQPTPVMQHMFTPGEDGVLSYTIGEDITLELGTNYSWRVIGYNGDKPGLVNDLTMFTTASSPPVADRRFRVFNFPTLLTTGSLFSFTVDIIDPNNVVYLNQTGAVTITKKSGPGTLSGLNTAPIISGRAGFIGMQILVPGEYVFTLTANGVEPLDTPTITIKAGSLSVNSFSTFAMSGVAFTIQPVVRFLTADGFTDAGRTNTVSIALMNSPTGGSLTSTSTAAVSGVVSTAAVSGVVTFSGVSIAGPPGNYTLVFSADGYTTVTKTVIIPAATGSPRIVVTNLPLVAVPGVVFSSQPIVTFLNRNGSVETTASGSVSVSLNTTQGSVIGLSTVSPNGGQASFSGIGITGVRPGPHRLTFSVTGYASVSHEITVQASTSAPSMIVTNLPSVAVSGVAFNLNPQVSFLRADGAVNTIETSEVSIILAGYPEGEKRLTGTIIKTATAGVATFSGIGITGPPGDYTLRFSATGYASVTQSIKINPTGQVLNISISVGPNTVVTEELKREIAKDLCNALGLTSANCNIIVTITVTTTQKSQKSVSESPNSETQNSNDAFLPLFWESPTESDPDFPITHYAIEYREKGKDSWTVFARPQTADTIAVITGLKLETLYEVRLAAVNANGVGEFSDPIETESIDLQTILDFIDEVASQIPTSIETEEIPKEVSLSQNYPNPFNPTTTIRYALPELAEVTLEVYNTLGQRVAVLVQSQQQSAGWHTAQLDASGWSSGAYIYRLRAGDHVITKKLLLIK